MILNILKNYFIIICNKMPKFVKLKNRGISFTMANRGCNASVSEYVD